VPIIEAGSLGDVARAGLVRIGTSSHHGSTHTEIDLARRVALVLGNEAHGLSDDADVDEWVTIPHAGRAESLNVAMAGTVLCFEVARQRRAMG
jgi:TrmH family RNA methyltransferase